MPPPTRAELAKHWLSLLPTPEDGEWEDLSEWEQGFLESVRKQFDLKGDVSEKQYECLERIYKKV